MANIYSCTLKSKKLHFLLNLKLKVIILLFPCSYSHPYEYELQHWSPDPSQLTPVRPVPPKPLNETPLTMVTTEEQLADVVQKLKNCTEFAVDLEVLEIIICHLFTLFMTLYSCACFQLGALHKGWHRLYEQLFVDLQGYAQKVK